MSNISNTEMALREKRFLDLWRKYPTYRCQASRHILEDYLDNEMLSIVGEDGSQVLETAFAICRSQLAERIPEYVPPAEPEPEPEKPKRNAPRPPAFNDPKWTAASLREHIRNTESMARAENRKTQPLPPEFTREKILSKEFSGEEMRKLVSDPRYGGMAAVQRRLDGKE